jgi:hypothetical protein
MALTADPRAGRAAPAVEPGDVAECGELVLRFLQFQGQFGEGLAEDGGGGLLGG